MAPFIRIALECSRAAGNEGARPLPARLQSFLAAIESGPAAIARRFQRALPARRRSVLLTHSYSGTVARALIAARSRIDRVLCSEGRPNYEGRRMARELAAAGIPTDFLTDSAITEFVRLARAIVVGADAICDTGMRNKVGTSALIACALHERVPVWVLADTSKLLPPALCDGREKRFANDGSPREVWLPLPARIRVLNPYFGWTNFRPGIHLLTEKGWATPLSIRKQIARLHLPETSQRRSD